MHPKYMGHVNDERSPLQAETGDLASAAIGGLHYAQLSYIPAMAMLKCLLLYLHF